MNLRKSKTIKKVKQLFVKKVLLMNYKLENENVVYELKLKNFRSLNKKIDVIYINNGNKQQLEYEYKQSRLFIKVPIRYLFKGKAKSIVKLYINGQKMWIKSDDSFSYFDDAFICDQQYFVNKVKKDLKIHRKYEQFAFHKDSIAIENVETDYDKITFDLNRFLPILEEENNSTVYAFKNNKISTVSSSYNKETGKLTLKDFSLFSKGLWQLFIKIDEQLYSFNTHELEKVDFVSYHHYLTTIEKNNRFYLLFQPHVTRHKLLTVTKNDQQGIDVEITLQNEVDANRKYILLIEDTSIGEETCIILHKHRGNLKGTLPLSELYQHITVKRFFLVEEGSKPIKYQFDVRASENRRDVTPTIKTIFESQIISFSFYKRKDASLGLKIKRPKVKKIVTKIEDFTLYGYVDLMDKFKNCQPFVYVEDRYSSLSTKVSVSGEFIVNLTKLGLGNLKSKNKTILDIFVIVENQEGNIIRKEKLKYQFADYKKDNYYDYYVTNDSQGNQQHFLISTTPFKNLKVESFSIPASIKVPKDTSIKDDNIWLIGERYQTAQDNGFTFFEWLQKNTNLQVYYVIEEEAPDYVRIKDNPQVLRFGSQRHFDIAFKAKVLLGTHDLENILPFKPAKGFFNYEKTLKVFLQHGVLGRKNVEYHKKYYENPFDLFIVSSEPEKYDIVVKKLGYAPEEVAVTGLARFDNLPRTNHPKDILLMPTWRDWINTDEKFLTSEYNAAYGNFIRNPKLLRLLETYDVNLYFYPHFRAQEYFKNIDGLHERIKFIPLSSKYVQQLLIDHALLITDYSSVSFDFTLMQKPVLFYHFDVKRFFKRGLLRPIEETFIGRIAYTEAELVKLVEERLEIGIDNFNVDITGVIKYQDHYNCLRIYNTVRNLLV